MIFCSAASVDVEEAPAAGRFRLPDDAGALPEAAGVDMMGEETACEDHLVASLALWVHQYSYSGNTRKVPTTYSSTEPI